MPTTTTYDRAYLDRTADDYLAALLARDSGRLPLAPTARFTENGQDLEPGDGLWATITELGGYRHYVTDPDTGQIGGVQTIREGSTGGILTFRLAVIADQITEIETLAIRGSFGWDSYEQLGQPRQVWFDAIPSDQQHDRETMIDAANWYFNGLQRNDGTIIPPFADGCDRTENGRQTTNVEMEGEYGHWMANDFAQRDAKSQFKLGLLQFVTEIRSRRFPVVDQERGVVLAFAVFDHNGTVPQITLTDGRVLDCPPYFMTPRSLPCMEIFKVENAQLQQIEANLIEAPYGSRHGWED